MMNIKALIFTLLLTAPLAGQVVGDSASTEPVLWRGLVVAPEDRCSEYSSSDYRYSSTVERKIAWRLHALFTGTDYPEQDNQPPAGPYYSPYDGVWYEHLDGSSNTGAVGTDIEHIVARSEAHDSGMCSRLLTERTEFANDLDNLTLAEPDLNQTLKSSHDAGEWLPESNRCWYAATIVAVKLKYTLTVDVVEAGALERILSNCPSTSMQFTPNN